MTRTKRNGAVRSYVFLTFVCLRWILHYDVIPRLLAVESIIIYCIFFLFCLSQMLLLVSNTVSLALFNSLFIGFLVLTWDNVGVCLFPFLCIRLEITLKALGRKWRDSCKEWNQPTKITDHQVNGQWKAISMCRRNVSTTRQVRAVVCPSGWLV